MTARPSTTQRPARGSRCRPRLPRSHGGRQDRQRVASADDGSPRRRRCCRARGSSACAHGRPADPEHTNATRPSGLSPTCCARSGRIHGADRQGDAPPSTAAAHPVRRPPGSRVADRAHSAARAATVPATPAGSNGRWSRQLAGDRLDLDLVTDPVANAAPFAHRPLEPGRTAGPRPLDASAERLEQARRRRAWTPRRRSSGPA